MEKLHLVYLITTFLLSACGGGVGSSENGTTQKTLNNSDAVADVTAGQKTLNSSAAVAAVTAGGD